MVGGGARKGFGKGVATTLQNFRLAITDAPLCWSTAPSRFRLETPNKVARPWDGRGTAVNDVWYAVPRLTIFHSNSQKVVEHLQGRWRVS